MSDVNEKNSEDQFASDLGMPIDEDAPLPSDVENPVILPKTLDEEVSVSKISDGQPAQVESTTSSETQQPANFLAEEDEPGAMGEEQETKAMEFTRTGKNEHAEMTSDPTHALDPRRVFTDGQGLFLVPCTQAEFAAMGTNAPRLDPTQSEQGARWQFTVGEGLKNLNRGDRGIDSLTRDGSLWRQSVRSAGENSTEITAGRPKITDRMGSGQLVGEEANQFLQAMLGTGQVTRIPLWHSGIWVNLKAPTEQQLLELDRRIAQEKILLGRISNGLAFSNSAVYLSSYLANFALSLVFDCSISGFTVESLKKRIALPDLPILLWGLLCTMYPNGYRYFRPCVADPATCTHVEEALLNITRLFWVDESALTMGQRKLMQRKTAKFTNEELDNYLSQHAYQSNRTVVLKEVGGVKTSVDLRVPTIADHEASGFAWVDGIVASTDAAFGNQLASGDRDDYIMDAARVSSLRQYAHWIERISFDSGRYIEDRATLEELVGQLTGDREVYRNFHKGIKKFIDDSTIALLALPYYNCPACKRGQHTAEEAKYPHLIPLDIQAVFFTLVDQRIQLLLGTEGL